LIASPQFLAAVRVGLPVPFVCNETHELGKELVGSYIVTKFISSAGSNSTITTAPVRRRSILKVKRTVGLSDRSDFKLDGIIAQHNGHSERCVVADAFIPIYPNTLPTVPKPSSASRTASLVLNKLEGSQSAITRLLTVSGVRKTSDKGSNPSLSTN